MKRSCWFRKMRFMVSVWHCGQTHRYCRWCKSIVEKCHDCGSRPKRRCHNCGSETQVKAGCPNDKLCFKCKQSGPLQWHHNGRYSVSNHQPHDCLLNRLFRCRSKKISKLRVTGLCAGNSPGPVNSPHKWPVTRKMFPFDDVIISCGQILPWQHNATGYANTASPTLKFADECPARRTDRCNIGKWWLTIRINNQWQEPKRPNLATWKPGGRCPGSGDAHGNCGSCVECCHDWDIELPELIAAGWWPIMSQHGIVATWGSEH